MIVRCCMCCCTLTDSRVQLFDKTTLQFMASIGREGKAAGELTLPHGIAVDDRWLYVGDRWRCQIFDKRSGNLLRMLGSSTDEPDDNDNASSISTRSLFQDVTGIAVDDSSIFISDSMKYRVQQFNKHDFSFIRTIGTGKKSYTCGVAVTTTNVYVGTSESELVEFRKDNGELTRAIACNGRASGVAVDKNALFVAVVDANVLKVIQ